jgi:hypothetical protein
LKNATHLLVFGSLLANVASMIWYVFYGYQASFHSDSAAKVLIAREIVETGDYFLDDEVAKSALQTAFAALRPDGRLI